MKACACRPASTHRDCAYCGVTSHSGGKICGICAASGIDGAGVIRGTEARRCTDGHSEEEAVEFYTLAGMTWDSVQYASETVRREALRNWKRAKFILAGIPGYENWLDS